VTNKPITYQPIGTVISSVKETLPPNQIKAVSSRIVLDPMLVAGLEGLIPGQKIMVIFHFHLAQQTYELQQHPKRDLSRPRRGVFALRSPQRPNGIGVTTVDLTKIEDNVLHVKNLDAIDGTPVLDLKPT
jgi:tRNA-Thr(GGU) m(6)t(6)A37 methyltransferase TsaA